VLPEQGLGKNHGVANASRKALAGVVSRKRMKVPLSAADAPS